MTRRAAPLAIAALAACAPGVAREPTTVVVPPASALPATAAPVGPPDPPSPRGEAVSPFELAIGGAGVCARLDGRVHCASVLDPDRPLAGEPEVEGVRDAVAIALGRSFGCAATRAGKVMCWGDNTRAQLGAGLRTERSDKAVEVVGVTNARRVFAGDMHACAILADGGVRCWGDNDGGQTGGASTYVSAARELALPNDVPAVRGATELALGHATSCALLGSREVACFGNAATPEHQRGRGQTNEQPLVLKQLGTFDDVTAMQGTFCGVRDGDVLCWGDLWSIVSGAHARTDAPRSLGLHGAKRVRLGQSHGCALTTDGAISCFGHDYSGALGHAAARSYDASPPEAVGGVPRAVDLAVGSAMSCAIAKDAEVWCWGSWNQPGGHYAKELAPVRLRISE